MEPQESTPHHGTAAAIIIIVIVLLIAAIVGMAGGWWRPGTEPMVTNPTTFAECVAAGGLLTGEPAEWCAYNGQAFTHPNFQETTPLPNPLPEGEGVTAEWQTFRYDGWNFFELLYMPEFKEPYYSNAAGEGIIAHSNTGDYDLVIYPQTYCGEGCAKENINGYEVYVGKDPRNLDGVKNSLRVWFSEYDLLLTLYVKKEEELNSSKQFLEKIISHLRFLKDPHPPGSNSQG